MALNVAPYRPSRVAARVMSVREVVEEGRKVAVPTLRQRLLRDLRVDHSAVPVDLVVLGVAHDLSCCIK